MRTVKCSTWVEHCHVLTRPLTQAKLFESGNGKPTAVLYFECPRDVLTARLLERANIEGRCAAQ